MEKTVLAGAGKEEILLKEDYLEIEEFAIIHRALNVRTIILEAGQRFVLVSIEMTSLPEEEIREIKEKIKAVTQVDLDHIWVSCTHTFSAPHFLPDFILKDQEKIQKKAVYRKAVQDAAVSSATKAESRMEPVTLCIGTTYCDINTGRDVELEDGWWIGEGGKGLVDHEVSVLRMDNKEGKPIAVLFNYAIQSSVLDGSFLSAGGKAVSTDIAGTACDYVERKYRKPHSVAMFMIGAAGDQIPVKRGVTETFIQGEKVRNDRHEEGFKICEKLGTRLGDSVCSAMEKAVKFSAEGSADGDLDCEIKINSSRSSITVPGKEMEHDLKNLRPVRKLEYRETGKTETEIELLSFGKFAIVGVKPELNCITAQSIKASSPYPMTWVTTMVNGASKYMADKRSYDRFTYEAQNSPFGKGAAEILSKECIALLEKVYRDEKAGAEK